MTFNPIAYINASVREFAEKHGIVINNCKCISCERPIEFYRPFYMDSPTGRMAGVEIVPHICNTEHGSGFKVVPITQEGIKFWSIPLDMLEDDSGTVQ